jgi:glycosyltransferase involved in cell wall biosynthesis
LKKIIHNIPFGIYLGGGERLIKGFNDNFPKNSQNYLFYQKNKDNILPFNFGNFNVLEHDDFTGLNLTFKYINADVVVEHGIGFAAHLYKTIYRNVKSKVVHYLHAASLVENIQKLKELGVVIDNVISNYYDANLKKSGVNYIVQPLQINAKEYPFIKRKYELSKIKVGIVGRISEEKIPKDFIDNLIKYSNENKNVEFYFLGAGLKHLEYLLKKIEGQENIFYTGTLKPTEINKFYKNVDILLSPSLSESGGYAILEAMSTGLPVIARSAHALKQTVGYGGYVAETNEDWELFFKLDVMLGDNLERFSEVAREKVLECNNNQKKQFKNLNKFILS